MGESYKDTAGPAINPMIKIANIVAILLIPLIISDPRLAALPEAVTHSHPRRARVRHRFG